MTKNCTVKIVLADHNDILRLGMSALINSFKNHRILFDVTNGKELTQQMSASKCPDIAILNINMPVMDGCKTAAWIRKNFPTVKILALSMDDREESIIKMIRSGANGYLLKDTASEELHTSLTSLMKNGYYYSETIRIDMLNNLKKESERRADDNLPKINDRENEFLRLACSELTYKEIASKMFVAPRTVDGYREALFEKLNVKNRVGLVLYAIKHNKVQVV
ncbi:MAG TPA: response regulator transcription factor [Bacteroidia bacterium]